MSIRSCSRARRNKGAQRSGAILSAVEKVFVGLLYANVSIRMGIASLEGQPYNHEQYRAVLYGNADNHDVEQNSLAELALSTTFKTRYSSEELTAQENIRHNEADI